MSQCPVLKENIFNHEGSNNFVYGTMQIGTSQPPDEWIVYLYNCEKPLCRI